MKSVKYLLAFAVLIALFAVINNQETSSFIENVITAVGVITTMAIHAWKGNTILSVVCGSAAYILLFSWYLLFQLVLIN